MGTASLLRLLSSFMRSTWSLFSRCSSTFFRYSFISSLTSSLTAGVLTGLLLSVLLIALPVVHAVAEAVVTVKVVAALTVERDDDGASLTVVRFDTRQVLTVDGAANRCVKGKAATAVELTVPEPEVEPGRGWKLPRLRFLKWSPGWTGDGGSNEGRLNGTPLFISPDSLLTGADAKW